jgi:hypothetical protein
MNRTTPIPGGQEMHEEHHAKAEGQEEINPLKQRTKTAPKFKTMLENQRGDCERSDR